MRTLSYMWGMLHSPRRTSQELSRLSSIRHSAALVISYGIFCGLGFLISAIKRDYPPPPETLQVWIDAWGQFTMLPFLKIPEENYRAVLAAILIPLALMIWMLMAATARLLSITLRGKASFDQYLNLTGFGFFPFLWIAAVLDLIYSNLLRPFAVPALTLEYGPLAREFFLLFPPLEYMILCGLGGVYNGIAAGIAERWAAWKSILVGALTFAWPTILIALLLR